MDNNKQLENTNNGFFGKIKNWFKNVNWKVVYDKATTGLLIFLLSSPFLILFYIILWFILKG